VGVYFSFASVDNPADVVLADSSLSLSAGYGLSLSVARGNEVISADAELPNAVFILATVKRRKIAAAYLALVLAYVYTVADTLRCIDLLAKMC
jgi:hypothetical protein